MRPITRCVYRSTVDPTANAWVTCGVCEAQKQLTVLQVDDDWRDVLDGFINDHYEEHGVFSFTSRTGF